MSTALACPECGCNDGSCLMGHVERGVYDGVLWWECLSCGHAWPRGGFEGRRAEVARRSADEHNAAGSAGVTRR